MNITLAIVWQQSAWHGTCGILLQARCMYGWVYGLHLGYVAMHMQHDEPYLTDCEPIDWAEYERWRAFLQVHAYRLTINAHRLAARADPVRLRRRYPHLSDAEITFKMLASSNVTTSPQPLLGLFLDVLITLERIGAPYMVVGAFAALLYGVNRNTHDIDVVVDLSEQQVQALPCLSATAL